MAGKRNRNGQDGGGIQIGNSNKKRRDQSPGQKLKGEHAPVDPTYGQRAAFPGIDEPVEFNDNDLDHEDTGDALSYLRSVRQEARGIPNLLVAPKAGPQLPPEFYARGYISDDYDGYEDDTRGYYDDGAYIAGPETETQDSQNSSDETERANKQIREAYYTSILAQYAHLRGIVNREVSQELIDALPPDHDTHVGPFGSRSKTVAIWTRRIRNTEPLPVQIAAMSPKSVFKLIRVLMKGKFMTPEYGLRERTSHWIWCLLARLPDRGVLDRQDISWIRELGKRAVLMIADKAHADMLRKQVEDELEDDYYDEGEEYHDDEDVGIHPGVATTQPDESEVFDGSVNDNKNGTQPGDTSEAATNEAEEVYDDNGEMEMDISDGSLSDYDLAPVEDTRDDPKATTNEAEEVSDDNGERDMEISDGESISDDGLALDKDTHDDLKAVIHEAEEVSDDNGERDMEISDGESLSDDGPAPDKDTHDDLEAAKARLLATLEASSTPAATEAIHDEPEQEEVDDDGDETSRRWSTYATLTMILTVAGELYGQRDLLDFRNPFPGE